MAANSNSGDEDDSGRRGATDCMTSDRVEAGAVHINNMTIHDEPRLPHGGSKGSGFGRFRGGGGLEEVLLTKTITFR